MRAQTLLRLSGLAAIAGGALRAGEPLLKTALASGTLSLVYFSIDVFLLIGLMGWYAWRAEKLGITGLVGFASGIVGVLIIRSTNLFGAQGYVIGATHLLLGLVVMNARALIRRDGPICPPLLWLIAFLCGLASLSYAPLALIAGTVFGVGYIFAGVSLLRS